MKNIITEMIGSENFSSNDNTSKQFVVQTRNFLVQTCSLCNEEMELVEGTTIYGNKWYHADCWDLVKKGDASSNV